MAGRIMSATIAATRGYTRSAAVSYDLHFFRPRAGESVEDALERIRGDEEDGMDDVRPSAARAAVWRARVEPLVALFVAEFPECERFDGDGYLELTHESTGVQLTLRDDCGGLSLPYWHVGADAKRVLARVSRLLVALNRAAHFHVFDPQLDRMLDARAGFPLDPAVYAFGTVALRGEVARRPWWKFW
jgi:hypothetical protein